ncbi:MAG: non-canonical purine NTP pyrophosphatase, RdgB/HAM1 family [Candidatus Eisenbacteria bacterium RBG_16_71_46]|nr:MAG: non-canonical purine NTP pyrophosphatase, RdgB/HAM1 family [Candidatus Eisenbacteria bacterium RBG_16_71_46]
MKLVLASFNADKARELAALLDLPGVELVGLGAFPGARVPEESGDSLEENALIKGRAAATHTGLPAIADDTGLEVDALGGLPGVRAARFAGSAASYADNVRLLLERLRGVEPARRTARFRTVCVACFPDGRSLSAEGVLEGRIIAAPRGSGGFGYDPVFEVTATGRTLAEMTAAEKNACSHRARAVRALGRLLTAS